MRRQSMRHVETNDEKNTLKVRRNSNSRRTSLADLIPDWPTLTQRKKVTKVKAIKIYHEKNTFIHSTSFFCLSSNGIIIIWRLIVTVATS